MSVMQIGCELTYDVAAATRYFFNVAPAETPRQVVRHEDIAIQPDCGYEEIHAQARGDRVFFLQAEPGSLTLSYRAQVELKPAVVDSPSIEEYENPRLPDEVLAYLNPSRYCESDRLARLAAQTFGPVGPGYSRVHAICEWTHDLVSYHPGCADERTSACDVVIQRAGVCRDYAHLAIAMCRAIGIPARYVTGYAAGVEPPGFHGFFEAYLSAQWYLFDPSRMAPAGGLVRIGTGRDAADAPFATVVGAASLTGRKIWANEEGAFSPGPALLQTPSVPTA